MAKLRVGISDLNGAEEARLTGVGGLEVAGERAFIGGVMDGLRYFSFQVVVLCLEIALANKCSALSERARSSVEKRKRQTQEKMDSTQPTTMTTMIWAYSL